MYQLYISKLNKNADFLWQRPKKKVQNCDEVWYDNSPVGRDPLNNAMKNLSANANLSKEYKNHSICATVVTNLDEKGFEARHIMATTGHKSEVSIKSYARHCPTRKRKEIFDALSENYGGENTQSAAKRPKCELTETVSTAPPVPPNFNLEIKELETINPEDLSDIFAVDTGIESLDVLDIITQIEKENQEIQPKNTEVQIVKPTPSANKTINFSNIQNVQQKLPNILPNMIFPHSNVTINYNFNN